MNRKKLTLNYLLFYLIGSIFFNIVFSSIKTIWINAIGGKDFFIENLLVSFKETWIFYTLVYAIIVVVNEIYKKVTIDKLNQKLNKIKEGSEENEK